ncbi:thioesterase II family protein [Kutzneria sp. 744]|uniref:thioesterase II family protein n=1 Tax=Kutzneria sp. (strain 744) TaxID=345341 RepID=UPI0003EEC496|nr:alpha/beta fold hydrolase [Kutzneria sp. 744]EWM18625.1 thioesterase [Kutzneria sp. 744]
MVLSRSWYLAFEPRPDARLRLYCLPCAGGGASMFRTWAARLPDWIELRAVRLPGRQGRHREPAFTDADTAVAALLDGLADDLTEDYAFFGHSMGALLAYRMTRELVRTGGPLPRLVAAASWPPVGAAATTMPDPAAGEEEFAEDVRRLGGVPDEILADPAVFRAVLPMLRADFALCRSYSYRPGPPLDLPVIAMGGERDWVTPPDLMRTWAPESTDFRGLHLYPGGHFFLREEEPALVDLVVRTIESVDSPSSAVG